MSLAERLADLIAVRGVRSAAIASLDGFLIDAAGDVADEADEVAGRVAGALAASRSLAELFGDGELRQATIEFEHGPMLLMPLPAPADGHIVVMVLEDLASLGRARLALGRARQQLADAVVE